MTRRETILVTLLSVFLIASGSMCYAASELEALVPQTGTEGWVLKGTPESFTKETLFEHINGQAEMFFQYGFQKSVFAVYQNTASSEENIDVDVYDMGNALQAFGIFSRFRTGSPAEGIGTDSGVGKQHALFYKGKYFVMLQATGANPAALKQLAKSIASRITDTSPAPKELALFPKTDLKPGTMEYLPIGMLGHQFLRKGFKAAYREPTPVKQTEKAAEDREFNLFLCEFNSSQEATAALNLFTEHLSKKGKLDPEALFQFGPEARSGTDPYQGKIILALQGHYLIGAVGFQQDAKARALLADFMEKLK